MQGQLWPKTIAASADPQRAEKYFVQLKSLNGAFVKTATPEQVRLVTALFSGSQFLTELLFTHLEWLSLFDAEQLKVPRPKQALQRELAETVKTAVAAKDFAQAFRLIRQFKQREMFRIGVRDLGQMGPLMELVAEISTVADVSLQAIFTISWQQLTERFGFQYHLDADERWQPTDFCVLGMGKLGGRELNYSSDVDLLFVYTDEGHVFKTPPRKNDKPGKGLSNHQFFTRLAEAFVAEVTRTTPEGFLYRVDMRLRPEGDAGPLARSMESYENYYAQWGQTWERMMLIKARCVAGDEELAHEFLETVQPFRYPRSLNERVLREIAAMKDRTENEIVGSGELERNVKLGRGGIREVEFIAQAQQILHAGKNPFLQSPQTLPTLDKLVQYKLLQRADAEDLAAGYIFLRDVEHRLQMEANQQTHTIPTERKARERLARLMGFESLTLFEKAKKAHCDNIRSSYEKLLKADDDTPRTESLPTSFDNVQAWTKVLSDHAFRDPTKALRLIKEFVQGPGYVHVSKRTSELAMELLPKMLALCPNPQRKGDSTESVVLSDPDRVVARLDSFVQAYGARSTLYELWTHNGSLFRLLLLLFDRSEFLAELAIRTPDMVDELELSGRLRRSKNATEIYEELMHGIDDKDQKLWLRRYHHTEFMRFGLRDILGLADFEQNLNELSALADACLRYALQVVMRRNKCKSPPFCIIGLGKLGGEEITYGSDLDVVFVTDTKAKNLPAQQKLAAELMDLLSDKTEQGSVFAVDARLRPDGDKGLLVNTVKAYEEYYRNRAQLWEIQSLTRSRIVAGDAGVGTQFQSLAAGLTDFSSTDKPTRPNAYTPDWKKQIAAMRLRIEKERTPSGKNHLAIKTGTGGLMDAEFLAQTFCLQCSWHEPNTLRALQRVETTAQLKPEVARRLIDNYQQLRRIEGILRRWSYEGETELPDDPAPLYRVSVRCGFRDTDSFMSAVKKYREHIRAVYNEVFAQK